MNFPVNIDENNLIKYNPKSEYYTEDYYLYTTENGTDILINNRHNFIGYENNTKKWINVNVLLNQNKL